MADELRILTTDLFERANRVRQTVFRLVMVLLGASLLAYPFAPRLLHWLTLPLGMKLVMYAPLEGFLGYITVSLAAGFCLTAPLVLYSVYQVLQTVVRLQPAAARNGTLAAGGLFVLGAGFCFAVILPVTLQFLLGFGGDRLTAGLSVSKYLFLTLGLSAGCGLIFELPLVLIILHSLGLISLDFLCRNRRYAILLSAIFTAILTPTPDAFTLSALLLPMVGLYEVSIILVRLSERRARRRGQN